MSAGLYNQYIQMRRNRIDMEKMTNIKGKLLEGCVWNEEEQKLYFVDIECRKIYALDPEGNELSQMEMPGYVSCIVFDQGGKLIAALPDGLYRVDYPKRVYEKIMDGGLPDGIRYNDGKCDRYGSLWVGSMAINQDENAEGAGALFCIKGEKIVRTYPGFTIPNGLAWNDERNCFFHIDTPTRKVDRYTVTEDKELLRKETAVDLSREKGNPDGMCMDSAGNLWIAMWGGGKVICADPDSGKKTDEIEVPDTYVSCCTFGGARMDRLYITTARDEDGNGGELYIHKMDVKGVEAKRYGG